MFRAKLANKGPYKANIGNMRLRLQELQKTNRKTQKLRSKNGYQEVNRVLHQKSLLFVIQAI